jgi:hypothetical protein
MRAVESEALPMTTTHDIPNRRRGAAFAVAAAIE